MTVSPSQTENFGIAARVYAPPTFTSRDPMFEKYFWLSPYAYCANNPVKYVDPTGMFDDEAEANKFHQRAVKKYGSERVGDVRLAAGGSNGNLTAIRVAKTAIDATNVAYGAVNIADKTMETFGAISMISSSVSSVNNTKKIKQ